MRRRPERDYCHDDDNKSNNNDHNDGRAKRRAPSVPVVLDLTGGDPSALTAAEAAQQLEQDFARYGDEQTDNNNPDNGIASAPPEQTLPDVTRGLTHCDSMPLAVQPPQMRTNLFPFQLQGLRWMQGRDTGATSTLCGGILADDMGLGKTVQMIATIVSCALRLAMFGFVVCFVGCGGWHEAHTNVNSYGLRSCNAEVSGTSAVFEISRAHATICLSLSRAVCLSASLCIDVSQPTTCWCIPDAYRVPALVHAAMVQPRDVFALLLMCVLQVRRVGAPCTVADGVEVLRPFGPPEVRCGVAELRNVSERVWFFMCHTHDRTH